MVIQFIIDVIGGMNTTSRYFKEVISLFIYIYISIYDGFLGIFIRYLIQVVTHGHQGLKRRQKRSLAVVGPACVPGIWEANVLG